jgi:hypothetical protein
LPQRVDKDVNTISDFRPLFEERESVIDQLRVLEHDLDELITKGRNLPPSDTIDQDLRRANRDLDRAKKAAKPDPLQIDAIQRYIDTTIENLQTAKAYAPKLQQMKDETERRRRRLFVIEQRIASLFDATRDVNRFRTNATYTFGVLVFLVVLGFYLIAWYKQGVAATIFAGELGMQFITLFLIVIAIILFGIMGTLEGRELAALLGGLSGYILGRVERKSNATLPNEH